MKKFPIDTGSALLFLRQSAAPLLAVLAVIGLDAIMLPGFGAAALLGHDAVPLLVPIERQRLALLVTAILIACFATLAHLQARRERHATALQEQNARILRSVKEGLFVIDRQMRIGPTYSRSLEDFFHRSDIAGLEFETLLKNVVADTTLATALQFVSVLWSERTNEKLVRSINPLGQVEVQRLDKEGRVETRYLTFDFHRIHANGMIAEVLVSVVDVTAKVGLDTELAAAQARSQSQIDTLLSILHMDPSQLNSFLADANAAMNEINGVLRQPARDDGSFRKKIDTLFRQVHSVKGEAGALGLSSIESRSHAFEEHLTSLRRKSTLSGNDFLPLVFALDELLIHLQSISDVVARLATGRVAPDALAPPAPSIASTKPQALKVDTKSSLSAMLKQLGAKVARDVRKQVDVQCDGLDRVPAQYRRVVKDIAVQAVRNAVAHGIETPGERAAARKAPIGIIRLKFRAPAATGYRFTIEDDGEGLSNERVLEVAIKKGFVTADEAATLEPHMILGLLFKPGFSTAEEVTSNAGRGVGMGLMAGVVRKMGGQLELASKRGKYTRVTVHLPPVQDSAARSEEAAAC